MTTFLNNQPSASFNQHSYAQPNPSQTLYQQNPALTPQIINNHYEDNLPNKKLGPVSDPPLKETCCNSCWWIIAAILGLLGLAFAILYGLGALGDNRSSISSNIVSTSNDNRVSSVNNNLSGQNRPQIGANNPNSNSGVAGQTNVSPVTYNNPATTNLPSTQTSNTANPSTTTIQPTTNIPSTNNNYIQPSTTTNPSTTANPSTTTYPSSVPIQPASTISSNNNYIQPIQPVTATATANPSTIPYNNNYIQPVTPTTYNTPSTPQTSINSTPTYTIQPIPYFVNPVPVQPTVQTSVQPSYVLVSQVSPSTLNAIPSVQVSPTITNNFVQPIPHYS